MALFQYYQDRGGFVGGVCSAGDPNIPAEPHGGIPYDITSVDPTICDSQSDLAFNAVKLGVQVQAAYQRSGKKVVLLGHSMGVAIIRGFLAYSAEHGDGVAETMVDSAVYLAGAQDGSRPFEVAVEMSIRTTTCSSAW